MSESNGTLEISNLQVPHEPVLGAESFPHHLQHRADSMSSMASSSAATSVIGDISDSVDDEDMNEPLSHSRSIKKETDRFGFKGGEQYTNPDEVILTVSKLRKRELKWLRMLDNWNAWMGKRFSEVKNRCRKGIPPSLRGRAWQRLSGSEFLLHKNPGVYENLLMKEANPNHLDDIEKDLHRQFPFHEMFEKRGGSGQQDLRNVLRAYTVHCPEVGYCQAQAPIVAVLLMHMPAEEAFWCMVAICDHYLPGYFSHGLKAVQIDGWVMQGLLKKVAPSLHKHMTMHEVQPVLYMTEWFMCVFARTLPWPSVLRLWDMFFCEGVKIIFRCGLVLLRNTLGSSEKLRLVPGLYETVESLRKIDNKHMQANTLIFEIVNLKITEQDLEREFKVQQKNHLSDNKSVMSKDNKRVYRYKPTHINPKQTKADRKKQPINSLSVDSAVIKNQVIVKKRSSSKKKDKKTNKTIPNDSENSPSKTSEVVRDNNEETSQISTSLTGNNLHQNDAPPKTEVVTSFCAENKTENDVKNHSQSSLNQDTFL